MHMINSNCAIICVYYNSKRTKIGYLGVAVDTMQEERHVRSGEDLPIEKNKGDMKREQTMIFLLH